MDDFVRTKGVEFLAHVLRRVSDQLISGETEWRSAIGISSPPRTSSTLILLDEQGTHGISDLAKKLRQSHQLVMTWLRQLHELGMVQMDRDPADARRTLVSLTAEGLAEVDRLRDATPIEEAALRELMREADADIFDAVWRIEKACRMKPFAERLLQSTLAQANLRA